MQLSNQKKIGWSLVGLSFVLITLLIFVNSSVQKQGAYLCELVSNDPGHDMTQCPAHNSKVSWIVILAFGVSFLVLGVGGFMVFVPIKQETQSLRNVDLKKLSHEEKQVYDFLKSHEGSMYQSDLLKETEMSKVKLTRLLDKMSQKGILDRKRRGMTNLVILK